MSSPFVGILTNIGTNNILAASGNSSTLSVTSFSVSDQSGDLNPNRIDVKPTWYTGTFDPAAIMSAGSFVGDTTLNSNIITNIPSTANLSEGLVLSGSNIPANSFILSVDSSSQITLSGNATANSISTLFSYSQIDVSLTIPPSTPSTPLTDGNLISEIYLFANVNAGPDFLLAIIHPPDSTPIVYADLLTYIIDLEIQFSEGNITGIFNFTYTSGGIGKHDADPNAHQRRWVLKTGDSMTGAIHEANPIVKNSLNGVVSLDETSNSFVIEGSETIASITGWTSGVAKIRWNTPRTITHNPSSLILIERTNRITQIGDVGFYEFTPSGCREISYTPISGYVDRAGDSIIGNIILDNNVLLQAKDINGTPSNIAFVDSGNVEQLGDVDLSLNLNSNSDPTVNIDGDNQTLYHTGNLKIKDLTTYAVNSGNVDAYGRANLAYAVNNAVKFKIGTVESFSDPNYNYINKSGAGASSIAFSNNTYTLNGSNQYLSIPKIDTLGKGTWEIQTKIKFNHVTVNNVKVAQGVIGVGYSGTGYALSLQMTPITTKGSTVYKLKLRVSIDGTSIDTHIDGTVNKGLGNATFNINTDYLIKTYFDGSKYVVAYYNNNTSSWIDDISISYSTSVYQSIVQLCLGTTYQTITTTPKSFYLNGTIDMSSTKFTIAGNSVFDGSLTYLSPNMMVTFPDSSSYEISRISDISVTNSILNTDGTYNLILEKNNLSRLDDGTYSADVSAVILGGTSTTLLPALSGNITGDNKIYLRYNGVPVNTPPSDLFKLMDHDYGTAISLNFVTGYNIDIILKLKDPITMKYLNVFSEEDSSLEIGGYKTPKLYKVYGADSDASSNSSSWKLLYDQNDSSVYINDNSTLTPLSDSTDSEISNSTPYQYYRIEIIPESGQTGTRLLNEITFYYEQTLSGGNINEGYTLDSAYSKPSYNSIVPIMTSNNFSGWVARASSEESSTYTAYKAFDGISKSTTGWHSGTGDLSADSSVYLSIGKALGTFSITGISISATSSTANAPRDFTIQDQLGNILKTVTGVTWNKNETKYYDVVGNNINSLKIVVTSTNQSIISLTPSSKVHIGEVKVYQTISASGIIGDYFLNISCKPYQPLKKFSTGWVENQFLKIGEVSKIEGILQTPLSYAFNGKYTSNQVLSWKSKTPYLLQHNIGTSICNSKVSLLCRQSDLGYLEGDKALGVSTANNMPLEPVVRKNTAVLMTGSSGNGITITSLISGTGVAPINTKWGIITKIERDF